MREDDAVSMDGVSTLPRERIAQVERGFPNPTARV